jgi:oligopeptide transport system substrate-binding protein
LTRIGQEGIPTGGVAESIHVSQDLTQYTFNLRESYWSNGTKVTAYDFEYAWKKILSPDFKTPFAYLFYPIKHARFVKEGFLSVENIGIKVVNDKTLIIELEQPTPYFLELTAHTLYSPVNRSIDQASPDWVSSDAESYICNGPFRIEKQIPGHSCELVKNQNYWDNENVKLEKILFFKSPPQLALEMFEKNEIDWIGSPLSAWESLYSSIQTSIHSLKSPRMIYWCACNTEVFPLNHLKIRQALAYAIHREHIIDALSYDGLPATTPLPLIHTLNHKNQFLDGNKVKARQLFQEALQELGLRVDHFPVLTFIHVNRDIKKKVARMIQQQWEETLGIRCKIEEHDWKTLFRKLSTGDYQLGGVAWASIIDDPLYILDGFKNRENLLNFTKWEHPEFRKALDKAVLQRKPDERTHYIAKAEHILMEEVPVIPIFHEFERYGKKPHLKGICISKVGYFDFKKAYISKPKLKSE